MNYLLCRFKERNDSGKIPSYEEIVNDDDVSEDEKVFEQQTEFEHKFNFRFEEPDQDFVIFFTILITNLSAFYCLF